MSAILFVLNGLIVGALLSGLCKTIIGDSPLSRLLRLVISIAGGLFYFILCIIVNDSSTISLMLGCFILFAPIGLAIIAWVLNYMFK